MSGILNSLLQGYGAGSQIKKERDAQQKQSKLAELMSQAYSAPREQRRDLIGQAIGVDPQAGFALQGQLSQDDDRRAKELVRGARALSAAPESMRPQLYAQMLPQLQSMGLQWLPAQYDASVAESAQKIVEAWAGVDDEAPEQYTLSPGSARYDAKGNLIASQPFQDKGFQGVWDSNRGVWIPKPGQASPQVHIDPSLPPEVQASIRADESKWANASPENPVNIGGAGLAAVPVAGVAPRQESAKPSALQERIEAAKRLGASEADIRGMVVGGPKSAPKPKDAIVPAVKLAQVQNVDRGIGRIESALQKLTAPGFNTGPVDALFQRYTKNGQELEAAVGAIQNSFLSLTRVPGVGSQSDLEARIAALQYPSLDKDPEVNRRTLQQLREFAEDLKKALQNAGPAAAEPDGDVDALIGKYL